MPQENPAFADLTEEGAKEMTGGRLPHFIPRPDEPEENAELNCAEGEALMLMIQEAAGTSAVVAEDLGVVPKYVPALLKKLGVPGFPFHISSSIRKRANSSRRTRWRS